MSTLCFGSAVGALLLALQPGPPGAAPGTLVEVQPVVREGVPETREFVGTVQPLQRTVIGSAVDGRVEEFQVNEGQRVRQGDVLAELQKGTTRLEVAAAAAELDLRKYELEELRNGTRPEEREQARAAWERAVALSKYAESRFQRLSQAAEQLAQTPGGRATISAEELEEAESAYLAARQSVAETKAAYNLALEGPRVEQKRQAEAREAMAQATLDRLLDQLSKFTIKAYFDGYVTAEHTEVGAWLVRGDPVVDMINLDEVEIMVSVPERYLPALRVGAAAETVLEAMPAKPFSGRIDRIVPQADVRSRSFPVVIQLANPTVGDEHVIKSGMLARVRLEIGETKEAVLVSKDALVLRPDDKPLVFVLRPGPEPGSEVAVPVPVDLGVTRGSLVEVIGDVREGNRVVVLGNERLSARPPFDKVLVRPVGTPSG